MPGSLYRGIVVISLLLGFLHTKKWVSSYLTQIVDTYYILHLSNFILSYLLDNTWIRNLFSQFETSVS